MARDPKNVWQETPKQIRQKVKKFISIPQHFAIYCRERGLLENIEGKADSQSIEVSEAD